MKRIYVWMLPLLFASVLAACGKSDSGVMFDASTEESVKQSLVKMSEGLSEDRAKLFKASVFKVYMLRGIKMRDEGLSKDEILEVISGDLHGKSVDQIINFAAQQQQ